MANVPCCCGQPQANGHLPAQQFSRMIVLGFYDGPTSGTLQCASCAAEYRFDLLDWDEDHEVRIFRLAALPPGSLDRFVAALKDVEEPRWPVWLVFARKRPSEAERDAVDRQWRATLCQASPAEWVVAWSGYGDKLLAAKKIPADELAHVPDWFSQDGLGPTRDWFGLLGLRKDQAHASV